MAKLIILLLTLVYASSNYAQTDFEYSVSQIPTEVQQKMLNVTWRTGCPVALQDLAYIQLSYWGFDQQPHQGTIIVNKLLAIEVIEIFQQLYQQKFPIQQMQPYYHFDGDDDRSMQANNTAAFNCRENVTNPGEYSQHSYGRAIDINPMQNPYVRGNIVLPPNALSFVERKQAVAGIITEGDPIIEQAFKLRGWDWGGYWQSRQDYQHFEKRANGVKAPR